MNTSIPTVTLQRKLPYSSLQRWEEFESLIVDLIAKNSNIEETRRYLKQGNNQQGIDIYAIEKLENKAIYFQCKKWEKIFPSTIKDAVDLFLEGKFAKTAKRFVFCTNLKTNNEKIEDQIASAREQLHQLGIEFTIWDEDYLNDTLYEYPEIVNRFFGVSWVKIYNGEGIYQKLVETESFVQKVEYKHPANYIPRTIATFDSYSKINNFYRFETKGRENTLVNLFLEPEQKNIRIILLASAGFGKSMELQNLVAHFSNEGSTFLPILLSLKNYTGESVEEFLDNSIKHWKHFREEKIIIVLDGLDEVKSSLYDNCIAKINQFLTKFPQVNCVVSARNIAYTSTNDPNKERLQQFTTLYLEKPGYRQVYDYLHARLAHKFESFMNLLHKYSFNEWLELPFFLNLLVEKYIVDGAKLFPIKKAELIEWFIERKIAENKGKYISHHQNYARVQSSITKNAETLAFVMTMAGVTQMEERLIVEVFPKDDDIINLRYSEVITSNGSIEPTYSFEHNNFREFLTAKILKNCTFEKIRSLVTFAPTHERIKPKWINVLAFLYEVLPVSSPVLDNLSKWITQSQPEVLVSMEEDKISLEVRFEVFKKIVLTKKQKSIQLFDDNLRLERLAEFSGLTDQVIDFIIEELESSKDQLYNTYRRDLVYILRSSHDLNLRNRSEKLKQVLLSILNESTEFVSLHREAIECLGNNRLINEKEIASLIMACPSIENLSIRNGFCHVINEYKLNDLYIDFLIDTISADENEKKFNPRRTGDISWTVRTALLNIKSDQSIIKLLNYISEHSYLLDSHSHLSYHLPVDFINDFFKRAANIKTFADEVEKIIYSIVDKIIEDYSSIHFNPFRNFLLETGNSRKAFLRYMRRDKPKKARSHYYVQFLSDKDFEWLLELLQQGQLSNSELKEIIIWLKLHELVELSKIYYEKYRIAFPNDPFSNPEPEVDWEEVKRNQSRRNQYLLLHKEAFIKEAEELFRLIGKEEITYHDIVTFEFDHGKKRADLDNTLLVSFIRKRTARNDTYRLESLIRYFNNENAWDEFVFNSTVDLIQNKEEVFENHLIERVKSWFNDNIYEFDFRTAKWDDLENTRQWHYIPKAELLIFLFRELNLTIDDDKLLEMLSYDNSGIHDYNEDSTQLKRLSELVIKKISDDRKVRAKIVLNLEEGKLVSGAILNHIRLVKRYQIKELAESILTHLNNRYFEDFERSEIVEIYSSLTENYSSLEHLILESTEFKPWMYKIIELLVARGSNVIETYLLNMIKSSDLDESLRTFIANQLIGLKRIEGFVYYFDYLLEHRSLPTDAYQHRSGFVDISDIDIDYLMPYFARLLDEYYRVGFTEVENESKIIEFLFENATNISLRSEAHLRSTITLFERIAELYKAGKPAARYLYRQIASIESNFYLNYPENITIWQAKKTLVELDTNLSEVIVR